jgi:hypothetical protein
MKKNLKKPRIRKIKLKVNASKLIRRRKAPDDRIREAFANVPKITNETVTEHREEVLSSARKYIYPLQHSRKRIVYISTSIVILAVVFFFTYIGVELYKFQSTSGFIYGVTQVIPFPVAKVGSRWVSYESYLFELRRYMHYYQTQQQVNFFTPNGIKQLDSYKLQALNQVITNTYVNELASENRISISNQAVNNEITMIQSQNRLGSSQQQFNAVLSDFWGWNEADFKRELRQQMIQQAVTAKLDIKAEKEAQTVLNQLNHGANFGTLAAKYSSDTLTKNNGGQFPSPVAINDPNISPIIAQALFTLKPGHVSGILNTGYTLEIVKVIQDQGNNVIGAHISFSLQPISTYIAPLEKQQKPIYFIHP